MKTTSIIFILAFNLSFLANVIQGQVYPPVYMQEESGDSTNEEMTPESRVIELIKEKDCFTPLNILDEIEDIDFRDKFGGTMLMYSSLNGCYEMANGYRLSGFM